MKIKETMSRLAVRSVRWMAVTVAIGLAGSAMAGLPTITVSGNDVTISTDSGSHDNIDTKNGGSDTLTIPAATDLDSGTVLLIKSISLGARTSGTAAPASVVLAGVSSAAANVTTSGYTDRDKYTYVFTTPCLMKVGTGSTISFRNSSGEQANVGLAVSLTGSTDQDDYLFTTLRSTGGNNKWSVLTEIVAEKVTGYINQTANGFTDTTCDKMYLSGVDGYMNTPNTYYANVNELVVVDGAYTYGYKIVNGNSPNNGSPNRGTAFKKLSGTGTITNGDWGSAPTPVMAVCDSSEFAGSINIGSGTTRPTVLFCTEAEIAAGFQTSLGATLQSLFTTQSGRSRIYVSPGRTTANNAVVTVPAGKTWTAVNGITNKGELIVDGTVSCNIVNDGTLTVNGTVTGTISGSGTAVVNEGATIATFGSQRAFTGWTIDPSVPVKITMTTEEYGKGSISVTGVASIPAITVLDPTGATIGTITPAGESTATLDTGVKISGAATDLDLTCDSASIAWDYASFANASTQSDEDPVYSSEANGIYARALIYSMGTVGSFIQNNSGHLTLAVVGQMSPTANTIFLMLGNAYVGGTGTGLVLVRTDNEDEVLVGYNSGRDIHEITRMTVPNAATARHVYVITKEDDTTQNKTTFTVYLDGIKWKAATIDLFTLPAGGIQIGADYGGGIRNHKQADGTTYITIPNEETETGVLNALRVYGRIITPAEIAAYSAAYPYTSPNGSSSRTFDADGNWIETETTPWATKLGEVMSDEGAPLHGSALTLTVANDPEISVNLDENAVYEALTLTGDSATFDLAAGKTGAIRVTGAITIGAATAIENGALKVGGPITLIEGGSLDFNYADYDVSGISHETDIILANGLDEPDGVTVKCTPPSNQYKGYDVEYRASSKDYVLTITPKAATLIHSGSDDVVYYTVAEALEDAVAGDTVQINNNVTVDSLTIDKAVTLKLAATYGTEKPFNLTVGTLNVSADLTVIGTGTLSASAVTVSGDATITGYDLANATVTVTSGSLIAASAPSYTLGTDTVVDTGYTTGVKFINVAQAVASVTTGGTTNYYTDIQSAVIAMLVTTGETDTLELLNGTTLDAVYQTAFTGRGFYYDGSATVTKAVATCNNRTYGSLATAVDAANDGATVTLLRASSEAITLNKAIALSETANFSGTLSGSGTLTFAEFRNNPSITFTDWTGAVVLPSFAAYGTILNKYGVTGSTVVLKGITSGWLNETGTQTVDVLPTLQLDGNVTITGFSTSWTYTFAEITGSGTFSLDPYDNHPHAASITKVAEGFSGSIYSDIDTTLTIGTLAREAGTSTAEGTPLLTVNGDGYVEASALTIGGESSDVGLITKDDGIYVVTYVTITIPEVTGAVATAVVGEAPVEIVNGEGSVREDATIVTVTYAPAAGWELVGQTEYTINVANNETTFTLDESTVATQYVASVPVNDVPTSFTTLAGAIAAASSDAENPSTVTLLTDCSEAVILADKTIVFAENGYEFSGTLSGNGTIRVNTEPSSTTWSSDRFVTDGWTGTFVVGWDASGKVMPDKYGIAGSLVKFAVEISNGYFNADSPYAAVPNVAPAIYFDESVTLNIGFRLEENESTFAKVGMAEGKTFTTRSSTVTGENQSTYYAFTVLDGFAGTLNVGGSDHVTIGTVVVADEPVAGECVVRVIKSDVATPWGYATIDGLEDIQVKVGDAAAKTVPMVYAMIDDVTGLYPAVANVGEDYFATLADAVAGQPDNAVVELLLDTDETVVGWTKSGSTMTKNQYTVTWSIDGTNTDEEYYYGATPTHADPTKEYYSFTGWTPAICYVTDNVTYTAQFSRNRVNVTIPTVLHATLEDLTPSIGDWVFVGQTPDYITVSVLAGSSLTITWAAQEGYFLPSAITIVDVGSEAVTVSGDGLAQPAKIVARFYASADATDSTPYAALVDGYTGALVALVQALPTAPTAYVQVIDDTDAQNVYGDYGIGYDATSKCYAMAVAIISTGTPGEASGYLMLQEALDAATSDDEVILKADNSEALTLTNGKTVTIRAKQGPTTYTYNAPVAEDGTYTIDEADAVDGDDNPIAGVKVYTARYWYIWTLSLGDCQSATVEGLPADVSEGSVDKTVTFTVVADYGYTASVTIGGAPLTSDDDNTYTYVVSGNATVEVSTTKKENAEITCESGTTVVPVPRDCKADELIDITNRDNGDQLKAYVGGKYYAWQLVNGKWDSVPLFRAVADAQSYTEQEVSAKDVDLKAGKAVWLTRMDISKPIKLLIPYTNEPVAVEVVKGWNLVAPTTGKDTTVKTLLVNINADEKDAIAVPSQGAPKVYTKVGENWGYADANVETVNFGGKEMKVAYPFHNTADTDVPAGTGVWFINGTEESKDINL